MVAPPPQAAAPRKPMFGVRSRALHAPPRFVAQLYRGAASALASRGRPARFRSGRSGRGMAGGALGPGLDGGGHGVQVAVGVELGKKAVGLAPDQAVARERSGGEVRAVAGQQHRRRRRRSRRRARGGRPDRAATAARPGRGRARPRRPARRRAAARSRRGRRASAPSGSRRAARAHSSRMRADQTGAKPPAAAAPSSISRSTVGNEHAGVERDPHGRAAGTAP